MLTRVSMCGGVAVCGGGVVCSNTFLLYCKKMKCLSFNT